ncbi:MAG: MerR family transcriptional regulator [Myxococcales bacterium]|nr:MerR family transcriptional regulator [Myxococcales bacterium]MCB9735965.1 MerR family transcriptional regulator [Deltaproteobacteria bacterium]
MLDPSPPELEDDQPEWMSIGALARATGVPAETIRSWERRYGAPVATRLPSGHRRYALAEAERLRLVTRALDLGHRPSDVVAAPLDRLEQLVAVAPPRTATREGDGHVQLLLELTRALDEAGLNQALQRAADELGARRFVHECAVPFMALLGEAWRDGRIAVMHEHFATARVRHHLVERRRGYETGSPTVVCGALPGELHDMGLHVSALLLAVSGIRVVSLGADTPVADLALAVERCRAAGLLLGSSRHAEPEAVARHLAAIERAVAPDVWVAVGGAESAPPGITLLADFHALERWASGLTARGARG